LKANMIILENSNNHAGDNLQSTPATIGCAFFLRSST